MNQFWRRAQSSSTYGRYEKETAQRDVKSSTERRNRSKGAATSVKIVADRKRNLSARKIKTISTTVPIKSISQEEDRDCLIVKGVKDDNGVKLFEKIESKDRTAKHLSHDIQDGVRTFTGKHGDRYVEDLGKKKVEDELQALSFKVSDCKVIDFDEHSLPEEDSDSDAYDTDLEESLVVPHQAVKKSSVFDPSGTNVYLQQCKEKGLIPISYLVKHFKDTMLTMRYHMLDSSATECIAQALVNNTCVTNLDLSGNHIDILGGKAIVMMMHDNTMITDLTLSDNCLMQEAGIEFGKLLQFNTTLRRLNLKGNHLNDAVAKSFAESLKENRTLYELDLSYNEFEEHGGLYLGAGLKHNYGLRILNLKWNCINNKGGVSIATSMRMNSSLTKLDLSWNGVAYIGSLAFGKHLIKNETLLELDLSNNRIGPTGAEKIAVGLAKHPCLEIFKISLNPIGDEGVMHLLKAVKKSISINYLGLEGISISTNAHQEIVQIELSRSIKIVTGKIGLKTKGQPPPAGVPVLVQFIQDNRLRLSDLFHRWDKDKSGDISREEFITGLKSAGIKMEPFQLQALVDQLDLNNNNKIDYSEILAGKNSVMLERRFKKRVAILTEQRETEKMRLPKLAGF